MKKKGNRNFGVWNPPSGMDNVKLSIEKDFELVAKLNDLNNQTGKKLGIRQDFTIPVFKINASDQIDVVNNQLITFFRMSQQGWGGAK